MGAAGFMDNPVIIVTSTIMDGQVVRWYESEESCLNGFVVLSASRNGVIVHYDYAIDPGGSQPSWSFLGTRREWLRDCDKARM